MPKMNGKPKRPTRLRLTYRQHSQEEYVAAWKTALGTDGICLHYLYDIIADKTFDENPQRAAFQEGIRALARELVDFTLNNQQTKVERNLEG